MSACINIEAPSGRCRRRSEPAILAVVIEYVEHGDLLAANAEALVNPVNTKGAMGKGLAAQFKHAFPENYSRYRAACAAGEVRLGEMFLTSSGQSPLIINFPTKDHWRSRSRMIDIETGLLDLRRVLVENDVGSVAIPALGCGLGGLPWEDVRAKIETTLGDAPTQAMVFVPLA